MIQERPAPNLPYELWRYILRLSANSDILAPWPLSYEFPIHHFSSLMDAIIKGHAGAQKTKGTIALTCRNWRDMTTSFLVEDVILHDILYLHHFVHLLEAHSDRVVPANVTRIHPHHVTRAVILSQRESKVQLQERESLMGALLRSCNNLEVLSIPTIHGHVWLSDNVCPQITDNLLTRAGSLRYLELGELFIDLNLFRNWYHFAALEVLSISVHGCDSDIWQDDSFEFPSVCFPRLHTLTIGLHGISMADKVAEWMSKWDFPHLINLSISPPLRDSLRRTSFFKEHGSKLVSLMAGIWSHNNSYGDIVHVLGYCNSLRYLLFRVVVDNTGTPFTPARTILELCFLIGPKALPDKPLIYSSKSLWPFLSSTSSLFELLEYPEIVSIQLRNFENAAFGNRGWKKKSTAHRWRRWIMEWEKLNIRLEDSSGELLRIPSELIDSLVKD
jgi:hypothetical protein